MDYKEEYLKNYKILFKQYNNEYDFNQKKYLNSVGKDPHRFTVYPDIDKIYYQNEEEFKNKMIGLNATIIAMSKFKIGDMVDVIRYGFGKIGKISKIKVSDNGSGELLYFFENPINPSDYLLEKDIVGISKDKQNEICSGKYYIMIDGKSDMNKLYDSYEIAEQEAIKLINNDNKKVYILMAMSLVELNPIKVTHF